MQRMNEWINRIKTEAYKPVLSVGSREAMSGFDIDSKISLTCWAVNLTNPTF